MRVSSSIAMLVSLSGAVASIGACGSSDAGAPNNAARDAGAADTGAAQPTDDAGAADAPAPYPAITPQDAPQVITGGGPVLKAPKIVPIFFSSDDAKMVASLTDFVKKVGQTKYWSTIVSEYGAGPATGLDAVTLTETPDAKIDDTQIQAWLATKLNANDPAFPAPDADTVYAIFYPAGVTITLGGGAPAGDGGVSDGGASDAGGGFGGVQTSCNAFGGYHQDIQLDAAHHGMTVAYAVVPRCADFGGLKGIDAITATASHELIEATTDPFPIANPAYAQVDDAHFFWQAFLGGGEVGDMCAQNPASFTKFDELPDYTVQRGWSNKAELAGHDPCVPPVPGSVYFNAAPVFGDTITSAFGGQTVSMKGVKIPVGQSGTVELDLFSDAPTSGVWSIEALDGAQLRGAAPQLKFDLGAQSGQNGDKIPLTITVLSAGRRNRETFAVISRLGSAMNLWVGVVGN